MADFDKIITAILRHEGGISDDPVDSGGLTKYGISQKAYPDLNIRALTLDDAKAIYRRDYWARVRGDDLPERVAYMVMDMAVNMGTATAGRLLQEALNTWATVLKVDGVIGQNTLFAVNHVDESRLIQLLLRTRVLHYARIVQGKPTQARFLVGWIARAFEVAGGLT